MTGFELEGFTLAGAEYWPYAGATDIDYPTDVLWGFYPKAGELPPAETAPNAADASPAAIACAEVSYAALRAFLATRPAALRAIVEGSPAVYVPKFYLWTNDYTRAATPYPPGVREARLWYWQRKAPDPARPPGYWKWEATVTQAGECQIPQALQIERVLAETQATLAVPAR